MSEFVRKLFASDFMPHGTCYFWDPAVLWLNVTSDAAIALSYFAIPILLLVFFRRRRDVSFRWVFVAFAAFIVACGATHLMGIWTVWHGTYRLDGVIKAATASASLLTAALLVPLLPALVRLPSPTQLKKVQNELQLLNGELERRVVDRTLELEKANAELLEEIERRKHLEAQLVQSQKMEAIGRLAGGVAHDFNNLLTIVIGHNEMIGDDAEDAAGVREHAQMVAQASAQAAILVNQLLAFGRRQIVQPTTLDLNETILRMKQLVRPVIGENIALTLHLDPELAHAKADPTQMDQIIMNLVVNARDAMQPRGGQLTIKTFNLNSDGQRLAALSITDTGTGMNAETRQRVFEPFFTTKEMGKGTGLGLAIVYGLVKQNGGDVSFQSVEGRGTTFTICVPAVLEPEAITNPYNQGAMPGPGSETILIVEDEEMIRKLASMMLRRQGYTVLESMNVDDAARICSEHPGPIHLLVTDVVMPKMSGPELAQELTRSRPEMKVLYMSGYADSALSQRNVWPDTAFIQKPFLSDALNRKVRSLLRS